MLSEVFFSENPFIYEIMWRYVVEKGKPWIEI